MSSPTSLPNFVVLDFETNGAKGTDGKLDVSRQLPTEVVAIRVVEGEVTSVFNTLVYYDHREHGWTEHLASPNNHHTKEELLRGMPEYMLAQILWQFLAEEVVVAYNALFDLQVAYEIFRRHFHGDAEHFAYNVQFIDPLTIARDRHPYPHKLGDMCKLYGIELPEAHLAMDDGTALVQLVLEMHRRESILPYLNVAGYKRQYGEPTWVPHHATLKPQGSEIIWHNKDGTTERRPGVRRNIVPAKNVAITPPKRVPTVAPALPKVIVTEEQAPPSA